MKGSPLRQSALVILGFLVLGIPVVRLTSPPPATTPVQAPPASSPTPLRTLECTIESLPLTSVTLSLYGEPLLEVPGQSRPFSQVLSLPAEHIPLVVAASIPQGRLAVRVTVRSDAEILATQTFWGDGTLRGVLEVPLSPAREPAP